MLRGTSAGPDPGEPTSLDAGFVRRWVRESAALLNEQRDYLTQLDAAIGDADHGVNMDRGFSAAIVTIETPDGAPPGEVLRQVGTTLIYRVGGAAGPLYGSNYRQAGEALGDETAFDPEGLL